MFRLKFGSIVVKNKGGEMIFVVSFWKLVELLFPGELDGCSGIRLHYFNEVGGHLAPFIK
jgi:hypothetical protein